MSMGLALLPWTVHRYPYIVAASFAASRWLTPNCDNQFGRQDAADSFAEIEKQDNCVVEYAIGQWAQSVRLGFGKGPDFGSGISGIKIEHCLKVHFPISAIKGKMIIETKPFLHIVGNTFLDGCTKRKLHCRPGCADSS
jgi:hypothetical protein